MRHIKDYDYFLVKSDLQDLWTQVFKYLELPADQFGEVLNFNHLFDLSEAAHG